LCAWNSAPTISAEQWLGQVGGGSIGPVVALRFGKYFSIQSGANFNINFTCPSKLQYTYLQAPVLMREDWHLPESLFAGHPFVRVFTPTSVFGGLAFNVPISASKKILFTETGYFPEQTATVTIPMSCIVGIGWKLEPVDTNAEW
jgi:hypothetical protein